MKKIGIVLLIVFFSAASVWAQVPKQTNGPKWFVLRHVQSGYCWPRLLIKIQGHYRQGWGQIAAGPYDTQEGAQKQIRTLVDQQICTNA